MKKSGVFCSNNKKPSQVSSNIPSVSSLWMMLARPALQPYKLQICSHGKQPPPLPKFPIYNQPTIARISVVELRIFTRILFSQHEGISNTIFNGSGSDFQTLC